MICFANRISPRLRFTTSLVSFLAVLDVFEMVLLFLCTTQTTISPKRCHSPFVTKVLKSPFSAFTNKFNWKQENLKKSRLAGSRDRLWSLFGKDRTNQSNRPRRVIYCLESYRGCILCKAESSSRTPLSKVIKPPLNWFWMQILQLETCFWWKIL